MKLIFTLTQDQSFRLFFYPASPGGMFGRIRWVETESTDADLEWPLHILILPVKPDLWMFRSGLARQNQPEGGVGRSISGLTKPTGWTSLIGLRSAGFIQFQPETCHVYLSRWLWSSKMTKSGRLWLIPGFHWMDWIRSGSALVNPSSKRIMPSLVKNGNNTPQTKIETHEPPNRSVPLIWKKS